jgi:hypothetical protein
MSGLVGIGRIIALCLADYGTQSRLFLIHSLVGTEELVDMGSDCWDGGIDCLVLVRCWRNRFALFSKSSRI